MKLKPGVLAQLIDSSGMSYAEVGRETCRARQTIRELAIGQKDKVSRDLAVRLMVLFRVELGELVEIPPTPKP